MEKIININFQSRVIAIEESAYDALKRYVDSLRRHFADEEGSEEIINDIENRIAELLASQLKQGAACINIDSLDAVIDSIGRIEDIKAAEGEDEPQPRITTSAPGRTTYNDRLFRNADDKIIAGVCSGIGNRMKIDSNIVRVIFVLLFGALFWIYILLWIILPSRSVSANITRRLFRNPDSKVLAGVCSGLAVYFNMDIWKIRLIFLFPLIFSILFRSLHIFTWHHGLAPGFFVGSFGSTVFILYVILWIAVPYATSSTDKMEMRGEKIDINSIKAATQARVGAAASDVRNVGSGIGKVIAILFKAFFLLIAGSVALSLFGALVGIAFAGMVTVPFSDFALNGWNEYALAWTGISLTLGIPLLALTVWIVRRLMGVRTKRHYFGYIFFGLWAIGIVCSLAMIGIIARNFTAKSVVGEEVPMQQPSSGRLYINVSNEHGPSGSSHYSKWFGDWNEGDNVFHIVNNDSLWLNTVKMHIEQSPDSFFHIYKARVSMGGNQEEAKRFAGNIIFNTGQQDSVISLPKGFVISKKDKFRNQQVMLTVEVPLGKRVQVSKNVSDYSWFTSGIHYINNRGDDYSDDEAYIMTANGLKDPSDTTNEKKDEDGEEE